jgi:YVTN family beta-propeller protein
MSIDGRLRRAAAALDQRVQEVDVVQRLGELQGRDRRQRMTAATVSLSLLLVVALTAFYLGGLSARRELETTSPVTGSRGRVVAVIPGDAPLAAGGNGSVWAPSGNGYVGRIDPASNRPVARIRLGAGAGRVALGAGAAWVTNSQDETVSRIDPATNKVVATIPVSPAPFGIGVAGGAVWVANGRTDTVSRIDPARNRVVGTVRVGFASSGVEPRDALRGLTVGYGSVWVINRDATVSRIDPTTNQVSATIGVPRCCVGELVAGAGAVWVANRTAGAVARIDPATNRVVATIPVGVELAGVAVQDDAVWVLDHNSGQSVVARIDPAANQVVARIPVDDSWGPLFSGGGAVWVINAQGPGPLQIYKIDPNA